MNNTIKRINILQQYYSSGADARNCRPFMFIDNKCHYRWYDRMVCSGTIRRR